MSDGSERLDELALRVDVRVRRRLVLDGLQVRLGYGGRRIALVLPEEAADWNLPEILRFLLETTLEAEGAPSREEWRAGRRAAGRAAAATRADEREAQRTAARVRFLLGPDLERFARAEWDD